MAATKDLLQSNTRSRKTVSYWRGRFHWFVKAAPSMDEKWRKRRCRELTVKAIRLGIINRPLKCQHCGERLRVDAHHESYNQPLEVQWLCRGCHKLADKARETRLGIVRKGHPYHFIPQSIRNEACRLWATGKYNQMQIGRLLGMHNSTVSKIVRGLS